VLRHLLLFFFVCVATLFWLLGLSEWKSFQGAKTEAALIAGSEQSIRRDVSTMLAASQERIAGLGGTSLDAINKRVQAVDGERRSKLIQKQKISELGPILTGQPIAERQLQGLRLSLELHVLEEERSYLLTIKEHLQSKQSVEQLHSELERLRLVQADRHAQWTAIAKQRELLEQSHPIACHVLYGTKVFEQCKDLTLLKEQLRQETVQAQGAYTTQKSIVDATAMPKPPAAYAPSLREIDSVLSPLIERQQELAKSLASKWLSTLTGPLPEAARFAAFVVLGIVFTPIAIKAFFYFVLAPLAARRPPVRLLPSSTGNVVLESGGSSVSRGVVVKPDQELLVKPAFLQSSANTGLKDTCWLLDPRFPLTSIVSGMSVLTRIRTSESATYVISSTRDPHSEIGVLSLPEGAALVIQPHNLVGVLQKRGEPVRITSHWRLLSLHAWLTLQLRYLAFHGPVKLVVQGCRGVRIEGSEAGRSISQAATIGFNANLGYSTRRCETFVSYLLGTQSLLNDCFHGAPGFYVYEEMPHSSKRAGTTIKWLEGLIDSGLKVFGI